MPTLHVHVDESGDLNFRGGSTHFTFATVWTEDPRPAAHALQVLRYELIKEGRPLSRFHARPDHGSVRSRFIDTVLAYPGWRFCAVVVRKSTLNDSLKSPARFYPKFMMHALTYALGAGGTKETERVLIYTPRRSQVRQWSAWNTTAIWVAVSGSNNATGTFSSATPSPPASPTLQAATAARHAKSVPALRDLMSRSSSLPPPPIGWEPHRHLSGSRGAPLPLREAAGYR